MLTATVEREELKQLIQVLPDEKIPEVLLFVRDFCHEEYIPNARTVKAIEESLNPDNLIGPFSSIESLMESLLSDVNA